MASQIATETVAMEAAVVVRRRAKIPARSERKMKKDIPEEMQRGAVAEGGRRTPISPIRRVDRRNSAFFRSDISLVSATGTFLFIPFFSYVGRLKSDRKLVLGISSEYPPQPDDFSGKSPRKNPSGVSRAPPLHTSRSSAHLVPLVLAGERTTPTVSFDLSSWFTPPHPKLGYAVRR